MTTNKFDFSEMVCFSLYSASNAIIRKYRPELEKFDLTYPQFLVMMCLWNKDDVHISELSEQTLLDASTLTQILKRLETKGFILRKTSTSDERAKLIVLTKSGELLKNKTSHIFSQMECRLDLSNKEQKNITDSCQKILSKLKQG